MLRQQELQQLQSSLQELRRELSQGASSAFEILEEAQKTAASLDLKALDELAPFLSPAYLKDLRSREVVQDLRDRAARMGVSDNGELHALLGDVTNLSSQLENQTKNFPSDELDKAYEDLRKLLIKGIKEAIARVYRDAKIKCEKAQENLPQSPKGKAKFLELEQQPRKAIEKFNGPDFAKILENCLTKFEGNVSEPAFSKSLENLSLADLVPLAKNVVYDTQQHSAFVELHESPVGENTTFQTYFKCEKWLRTGGYFYLEPTPEGTAFLNKVSQHELALVSRTLEVRNLQERVTRDIKAVQRDMQNVVSPAISECTAQINQQQTTLLGMARFVANESSKKIAAIKSAQNEARAQIAAFDKEVKKLASLSGELENLFSQGKALTDLLPLKEKMQEISNKIIEIGQQKQLIVAAKKTASEHVATVAPLLEEENIKLKQQGTEYAAVQAEQAQIAKEFASIQAQNKSNYEKLSTFISGKQELVDRLSLMKQEKQREKNAQKAIEELSAHYDSAVAALKLVTLTNESIQQAKTKVNELCQDDGASAETLSLRLVQVSAFIDDERPATVIRELAHLDRSLKSLDEKIPLLSEEVKTTQAYQAFAAKCDKLSTDYRNYQANPQNNEVIQQGLIAKKADLEKRSTAAKELNNTLIKEILVFFKEEVFSDTNIKGYWKGQVSIPGQFKAWRDGSRVSIPGEPKPIAVPRGVFNGRKWLDQVDKLGDSKKESEQKILLGFVKALSARLPINSYGREKPTEITYQAAKDALLSEAGTLKPVTENTLIELRAKINFKGLVLRDPKASLRKTVSAA